MEVEEGAEAQPRAMERFRRWMAIAVGLAVLGYLAYALLRGWRETGEALAAFDWPLYVPVLLLTLVNYGLRFGKWHYLLGRLGVRIPVAANLQVFATGLAMVISPGKAGELVKPYLIRTMTGTPMTRTIPALVAERATDGMAVVALAAIGVSTFYAEGTWVVLLTIAAFAAGLLVLAMRPLSLGLIGLVGRLPYVGGIAPRLEAMYIAMRTCLAPVPLLVTFAMSLVAWWAECVGYWLIFHGLQVAAPLDVSTFIYAFATVFGAPSPGGMGMADGALVEVALGLIQGLQGGQALAAALLVRLATLWFGVVLGALALFRIESVIRSVREAPARNPV